MKTIRYILTTAAIAIACIPGKAQMSNFSQYHLTPVYTSPAESGMTDYFQVLTHYRKQSLSEDQGFNNLSISGTYPLRYSGGRRFGGIGLGIMNESSGMRGIFNEKSVRAGYAYNWQASSMHHVSVGLQGGYYRTSLDMGNVTTDAQYQNGAYDPGMGLGEQFDDNVSQAFKIDAGATWYGADVTGRRIFALGFAAFNVTGSGYSFMSGDAEERLPVRYQVYGSFSVHSRNRIEIVPTFRYMIEKNSSQLNLGSLFLYQLDERAGGMEGSHFGVGVWYSLDNVAVVSIEWIQPSYIFSLSYDVSASSNVEHGQLNNGVELTLGWRLAKGEGGR